jgi:hypothetical protein
LFKFYSMSEDSHIALQVYLTLSALTVVLLYVYYTGALTYTVQQRN